MIDFIPPTTLRTNCGRQIEISRFRHVGSSLRRVTSSVVVQRLKIYWGGDRYSQLVFFNNVANTVSGFSPGNMEFQRVGALFQDGRPSFCW